jgi:uncharacterized membrane protein YkvA (DUF1232 family)
MCRLADGIAASLGVGGGASCPRETMGRMEWVWAVVATGFALVVAWAVVVAIVWLHRPTRDLALPALRALPDIARLARRLLADPRTPRRHRAASILLVVWLVSPIDLIPEFLPGIGPLDDVVAAAVILGWIGRQTGTARLRELWPGDDDGFDVVARMIRLPAVS